MDQNVNCSKCQTVLGENDTFCNNCGYPEKGTPGEIDRYNLRIKLKENVLIEAKSKLKSVKILLYVIAGINLAVGLFYMSDEYTYEDGIWSIITAVIFVGFVFWVNKQPLTGILAAFIFWIFLQLLVVFVDPLLLFQGLFMKVIFIAIFIKGISSAKDAKKYAAQLAEMDAG